MTCFLLLGKIGDLISGLSIIRHWFITTKQKPTVLIAREYAHVLDRVPYVTPLVYNGHWTDLQGAYRLAKQKFNHVVCLSTFGREFPIEHRTSSFQLEQYERAGVLKLWDSLPLSLECSDRGRFERQTILFADHSESSPFLQKQELYALLVESFPEHQVLRLSDYKLPHIADFVGWYDRAAALVAIETAHLHLSAATTTPVFAIATDKPTKWNGSAFSKRFSFFCRYSEFDSRKGELIEAMKDALAGIKRSTVTILK